MIAGLLWIGVGAVLSLRAMGFFRSMADQFGLLAAAFLAVSVLTFYGALFRNVMLRVSHRIRALPATTEPWRFLNTRALMLVGGMVLLGYVLRNADLPPAFLAYPYATMGGALLIGGTELILRRRHEPVGSVPEGGEQPTSEEEHAR